MTAQVCAGRAGSTGAAEAGAGAHAVPPEVTDRRTSPAVPVPPAGASPSGDVAGGATAGPAGGGTVSAGGAGGAMAADAGRCAATAPTEAAAAAPGRAAARPRWAAGRARAGPSSTATSATAGSVTEPAPRRGRRPSATPGGDVMGGRVLRALTAPPSFRRRRNVALES